MILEFNGKPFTITKKQLEYFIKKTEKYIPFEKFPIEFRLNENRFRDGTTFRQGAGGRMTPMPTKIIGKSQGLTAWYDGEFPCNEKQEFDPSGTDSAQFRVAIYNTKQKKGDNIVLKGEGNRRNIQFKAGILIVDATERNPRRDLNKLWFMLNHPDWIKRKFYMVDKRSDAESELERSEAKTFALAAVNVSSFDHYLPTQDKLINVCHGVGLQNTADLNIRELRALLVKHIESQNFDAKKFKDMVLSHGVSLISMVNEAIEYKVLFYNATRKSFYQLYWPEEEIRQSVPGAGGKTMDAYINKMINPDPLFIVPAEKHYHPFDAIAEFFEKDDHDRIQEKVTKALKKEKMRFEKMMAKDPNFSLLAELEQIHFAYPQPEAV